MTTEKEILQEAATLIDGAQEIIETWGETDGQVNWRNDWMKRARTVIRAVWGDERRAM